MRLAHRALLTSDTWPGQGNPAELPQLAALYEQESFSDCLGSHQTGVILNDHLALADSFQIAATPMFLSRLGLLRETPTLDALVSFTGRSR